jgi:hypothetical protein
MIALLSKLSRFRRAHARARAAAARTASLETLEDRRLYSVSPASDVASFSWGVNQTAASPQLQVPAVQHTGGANIIGVLIAL